MSSNGNAKRFDAAKETEIRGALLAERANLAKQIRALGRTSLVSSRTAGEELADVGTDDFMRDMELSVMTEEGKRLALIDMALESLDNGNYGVCVDCGKEISVGRLRAKPYARLCIDCKTIREKNDGFPVNSDSDTQEEELVE
ncbi:MAG: TraR/DksA family transcriptional regulator [Lentisphaeria bacterium]|jgi:DnaK suppressor protein|nr:TraR/DksA family transcriptional regulator [Lentisphaeria bacterium]